MTTVLSSWPIWGALVIALGLLVYRKQIIGILVALRALIERARHFKAFGASLDTGEQQRAAASALRGPEDALLRQESEPTSLARSPRDAVDEMLKHLPRTEYYTVRERDINHALEAAGIVGDEGQRARALLALVTVNRIAAEFERIYGLIWGSQMRVLQLLNTTSPAPPEQIKPIYDDAVGTLPTVFAHFPFDQYMAFRTDRSWWIRTLPDDSALRSEAGLSCFT